MRPLGLRARVSAAFALGALILSVCISLVSYESVRNTLLAERGLFPSRYRAAASELAQAPCRRRRVESGPQRVGTQGRHDLGHPVGADQGLAGGEPWVGQLVGPSGDLSL